MSETDASNASGCKDSAIAPQTSDALPQLLQQRDE